MTADRTARRRTVAPVRSTVRGSTRASVESPYTAQTAPRPTATLPVAVPNAVLARRSCRSPARRSDRPERAGRGGRAPPRRRRSRPRAPSASPEAWTYFATDAVRGAIRASVWSARLAIQTGPMPCGDRARPNADRERRPRTRFGSGSITATEFGATATAGSSRRTASVRAAPTSATTEAAATTSSPGPRERPGPACGAPRTPGTGGAAGDDGAVDAGDPEGVERGRPAGGSPPRGRAARWLGSSPSSSTSRRRSRLVGRAARRPAGPRGRARA